MWNEGWSTKASEEKKTRCFCEEEMKGDVCSLPGVPHIQEMLVPHID